MDDYYDECEYDNCDYSDSEYTDESEKTDSESSSEEDIEDVYSENELETIEEEDETEQHKTKKCKKNKYFGIPFLTKFEKTRVLGVRTEQILSGAKIFVETTKTDPYEIALEELHKKQMPLIIRRYFGNTFKDISVNKLHIL